MFDKEKLVDLMKEVKYPVFPDSDTFADFGVQHSDHVLEAVAEALVAKGVVVLPCKPGDTLYATHWRVGCGFEERLVKQKQPVPKVVQYISFLKDGEVFLHFKDAAVAARYVGEILFTTYEEARAALREGSIK